jgi:hypothetical protein
MVQAKRSPQITKQILIRARIRHQRRSRSASTFCSHYCLFKGTGPRDFRRQVFFHESVSLKPLGISLGPFKFCQKLVEICLDIRRSRCTTGVIETSGK